MFILRIWLSPLLRADDWPEGVHELNHRYRDGAFIMAMAGLNNIMRFAVILGMVFAGRGHSSEFWFNKLAGTIYPRKLLKGLYRLNACVSKGILRANVAGIPLSASTYSYILSFPWPRGC